MARRKRPLRLLRPRCERLEPRLVLSGAGLSSLAVEPLLRLPDTVGFDGVDDLIEITDRPELNTNEFTIALWMKAADATAGTQSLIARGEDWTLDKAQWVVELNDARNPGKLQLWYEQANDADHCFATDTIIESGRWYHFAATRAADGQVEIYLDGQRELERIDPSQPASVNTPVLLGARRNRPGQVQDYFDGSLHEVIVFDEVLSSQAIDELMEQTRPEACSIGDRIEVSPAGAYADVAMNSDGSFVTVWTESVEESDEVFARQFDAQGNPLGGPIAVNTTTAGGQKDAAVAARPDGGFAVVWSSELSGSQAIRARLFSSDGTPLGGELPVGVHADAHWGRPDVAVDGQGNFVVAWNGRWDGEGVLARRFDRQGDPLGDAFQVDTQSHTGYGWPQVAMNDAGWSAIASPRGEWTTTDLLTYDPGGRPISASEIDTLYGAGLAINDDGLLALSWIGNYTGQPIGDPFALYAQIFSIQGHEVGPRVLVTPGKAGGLDWNIYDSDVAITHESFVVTWKDYVFDENGCHSNGLYASRFDLEGRLLGEELELGDPVEQEFYPAVAMAENGPYVVAWQRLWGDGVFARTVGCPIPGTGETPDPLLRIEDRHQFDGVDDYLAIDQANLNINQYTVGFWFQADDPGHGEQTLIARGEDVRDKAQWIVQLNADQNPGKLQLWYEDRNDRDAYFASETTINAGQWYYATITRSSDGHVQIFVNGALERSAHSSRLPVSAEVPVLIGARTNAPNKIQDYFDGAIDDLTIFDEVLSAYQINRLMLSTLHGQEPVGPVYTHAGPIELNGVDQYLSIDDDALDTSVYTIALSFRADNPGLGTQSLIARGEDFAADKAQWVVELNDAHSPGRVQLWYEEANDRDHYFTAPTTIEADSWYHAAFTRAADGTVRIYIDGQQVYEETDPAQPASVDTPVLIGARTNRPDRFQDYFDGTIEDVQIYNYAMGPAEIEELVSPPRLELLSPVDGEVFANGEVPLSLSMDRPLTALSYSLDGAEAVSLIGQNWVYQENPDAAIVRSLGSGTVEFEYDKPEYAVAARWQYEYSTAAGTETVAEDLPQDAWDHDAGKVAVRVVYPDSTTAAVRTQYSTGIWHDWDDLGPNNPGGNGNDAGVLYDGNWATGAAYHNGARQWLTSVAGTYVKFQEEAIWWDVQLVEGAIQRTVDVAPGLHTMTIFGTDTLGKTSSVTVRFTVEADMPVVNGDFEMGELGPWVLTDSGAVVTADLFTPGIPPAGGTYMGYITTGRNELPSDLHFADLDGNGVPEREYSALAMEVSTPTVAVVEVDLNFLTEEVMPGGSFSASDLLGVTTGAVTDAEAYKLLLAVAATDGSYTGTATPLTANDFSDELIWDNPYGSYPTIADVSQFNGQTGFHRYSFVLEAGTHTLTFFVADSHTDGGATAMLIDNLTIHPQGDY
ncbi:MAG: LamG domain-containing protein [Pirellulales bacterium]|nr:LamG domain-containing protein [Pirellulales bacterium]